MERLDLLVESLRLSSPEVTLTAFGSVGLLAAGLPLAIDADGSAELDRLAPWSGTDQRPSGHVTFRAHATGSFSEPRAEVALASQDLAWQGLKNVVADASAQIDRTAVEIGSVNVRLLGGTAAGSGRVSLSSPSPGAELARVRVDWTDMDVATLLKALDEGACE